MNQTKYYLITLTCQHVEEMSVLVMQLTAEKRGESTGPCSRYADLFLHHHKVLNLFAFRVNIIV
jgi:hypothetical protein